MNVQFSALRPLRISIRCSLVRKGTASNSVRESRVTGSIWNPQSLNGIEECSSQWLTPDSRSTDIDMAAQSILEGDYLLGITGQADKLLQEISICNRKDRLQPKGFRNPIH